MSTNWMIPAELRRLFWLMPVGMSEEDFEPYQQALGSLASHTQGAAVYQAKRRSIYRAECPKLGAVGVKEIRNPNLVRRLWFRHVEEHPGIREFQMGSNFHARGGQTPILYGAALDQDALSLGRIFLFIAWHDQAVTLLDHLAAWDERVPTRILEAIADSLATAAHLGLVHGRHSPRNMLAVPETDGNFRYETIDFAYSHLASDFEAEGFARDAARIAYHLLIARACPPAQVDALLSAIAHAAWHASEQRSWEHTMRRLLQESMQRGAQQRRKARPAHAGNRPSAVT